MSSYPHEEFRLGLKVLATAAEKTFWLSTQADGTRDWGYHDESAPPTQSEAEAQIIELSAMNPLILASSSPYRKQLLQRLGLTFSCIRLDTRRGLSSDAREEGRVGDLSAVS